MQCPQCQHENAEGARFCDECGARLSAQCHACGTENRPGAKFCNECGISLTAYTPVSSPAQTAQPRSDAENRFYTLLPEVMARLQSQRRVTYRML